MDTSWPTSREHSTGRERSTQRRAHSRGAARHRIGEDAPDLLAAEAHVRAGSLEGLFELFLVDGARPVHIEAAEGALDEPPAVTHPGHHLQGD